jgi:hypothetical protein
MTSKAMNKHEFNNCAAWAKGWYQTRPNVKAWWMDLAHCINNDGWTNISTKAKVVNWILMRFDEDPEWWRLGCCNFGFADMYENITKDKYLYYNDLNLSTEDCIILYFRRCLSIKSNDCFTGGFKPSNDVLPLVLYDAYYSDGYFNNGEPSYVPAEMMCDTLARINQMFPDLPEQKIDDMYFTYESIETMLGGAAYTDIQIPIGSDANAKFTKTYTGEELNREPVSLPVGITNKYGEKIWADLELFSYCIGYEPTKKYVVHMEITKDKWGDECYTVKNITEA